MNLRTGACLLPLFAVLASAQAPHLVPIPRELRPAADQSLSAGIQLNCAAPCAPEDSFAIEDLKSYLTTLGIPVTATAPVNILVARFGSPISKSIYADSLPKSSTDTLPKEVQDLPPAMKPEGYAIIPDGKGLALTAATPAGIFYALQTIKQLIEIKSETTGTTAILHTATIRDWPALKYRGLHDDLSRGPVPTLDFQKKLVRTLAAYKVNLYSPYFESTQQYASLPLSAIPGASLSAADARELVAYAALYHVTIIPEQEAFGHLRHMLLSEQYADVAETPHGAVLSPGQPGSIPLIDGMFKDLAALYPGPFLHIGGDETVDLGIGRTKPDVDTRGLAPVYLDFLQQIVTALAPLHRKILFWGDIAQDSPALLKALPQSFKKQTIAVAWGYTPEPKGFARILKPYTEAGIETWVAPSINNYRQVWPNQQYALEDIQQFTRDGQQFGATGQLNTLWNDDGESLANMNWYGILFGAAAAWQPGESSIPAFQQSYGQVFHGDSTGLINQAQNELTAAMTLLETNKVITHTEGTDGLFWVDPWSKDGQLFAARMRPLNSELRLHAERAITLIAQARNRNPNLREPEALDAIDFGARRIDFLGLKFQLSEEMITSYAQATTTAAGDWKKAHPGVAAQLSDLNGVNGRLQDLTYGYSQLRDMYEQQWLRTYRPANLRPVLARYDLSIALWLSRIDKIRSAQRQWTTNHILTPAADLGIPALGIPALGIPTPPTP